MRVAGGMKHRRTRVGYVGNDGHHPQGIHEPDGLLASALQAERQHAARAVGQILLRRRVMLIALQAGVMHPCHLRVLAEVFGYGQRIGAVARHTQVQRLEAEVQQEGVHRRRDGTEVAHELHHRFGDVGCAAEPLRVDDAVVGGIGGGEAGELLCVRLPVEAAAVDDSAAHRRRVAVHVLRRGVDHDVGTPLEGSAVDGRGEGVVHDERHAVAVSYAGKLLDVQHRAGRVGDGLAEDGLRVRSEGAVDLLLRCVLVDEGEVDLHALHRHGEEVERAAVDLRGANDMVARAAEVQYGVKRSRLARCGEQGCYAAFECGDLGRHGVVRRVLQPGVEVSGRLEVEESPHLVA